MAALAREQIYQTLDHLLWQAFSWTPVGRAAYTRVALNHLKAQVPDPALRAKLVPEYPIGCKRVLITDDFYPALLRPNVSLVTEAIRAIPPTGVETADPARGVGNHAIGGRTETEFGGADYRC